MAMSREQDNFPNALSTSRAQSSANMPEGIVVLSASIIVEQLAADDYTRIKRLKIPTARSSHTRAGPGDHGQDSASPREVSQLRP